MEPPTVQEKYLMEYTFWYRCWERPP
ncbi:hypothetical protein ID866_10529 [Astraeus odoratus]|nr:hypothetical protein ID866_10529 [Astraeus odoratus]